MPPVCPRCGRPRSDGLLCPGCANWSAEIDGIRSPFIFDGVLRRAIHEFKYRNLRALAVPLAELLYGFLLVNPVPGEVLVPVPLHRKRWRERGYNQSGLLAEELGKLTGLPVVDGCLFRQQHSPSQARTASVSQRQSNVTGAFACRGAELRGKRVLLIDDVCTSGATLNACAGVLKSAGAASVWGLVIAEEI
jgi:ComF family protein